MSDGDRDVGLFGPDSVTWRIHSEPIITVGGIRSLFLQALHPRAVAGVAQNSRYKSDALGRFQRTSDYVGVTVFGSTARAEAAGRRVRAIHARMRARDPVTGETFRIDEPELLCWVHVTEVDSYLCAARRGGVPLSDADADRYLHEQCRRAALVGLDPATVPGSRAEVAAYYERMRPRLRMTVDAADTALFLVAPKMPWGLGWTPARPAWTGIATAAFALLPRWARRMYGLPGLPTTDLAASLTVRVLRSTVALIPRQWYESPWRAAALARAASQGDNAPVATAAADDTAVPDQTVPDQTVADAG